MQMSDGLKGAKPVNQLGVWPSDTPSDWLCQRRLFPWKLILGKLKMMQTIALKTGVGPKQSSEFELPAVLSIKELDSDIRYTCAASLSTSHLEQDLLTHCFVFMKDFVWTPQYHWFSANHMKNEELDF